MALLFLDASALVKRYYPEIGSQSVDLLIANSSAHPMVSTPWGYAETYSILLRRFNGGVIDLATFTGAVSALQAEVVQKPEFGLLTITDAHVFSSIGMMHRHNLNATDAVLLTLLVEFSRTHGALSCVLIASDHRFLRAAASEGLPALNPETLVPADVPGVLAAL